MLLAAHWQTASYLTSECSGGVGSHEGEDQERNCQNQKQGIKKPHNSTLLLLRSQPSVFETKRTKQLYLLRLRVELKLRSLTVFLSTRSCWALL